jgi:hypothetical protein
MSYEQKYLKYKAKYLSLKNNLDLQNQIGSGTKFINAVKQGDIKTVEEKLTKEHGFFNKHKANPNQIDKKTNKSALQIAIDNNNINMAMLLVKHGARVESMPWAKNQKNLFEIYADSHDASKIKLLLNILFDSNDKYFSISDDLIVKITKIIPNIKKLIELFEKKILLINKKHKIESGLLDVEHHIINPAASTIPPLSGYRDPKLNEDAFNEWKETNFYIDNNSNSNLFDRKNAAIKFKANLLSKHDYLMSEINANKLLFKSLSI